jgi:peptidoglycan/LPS O-acetylase OafA/YrhL
MHVHMKGVAALRQETVPSLDGWRAVAILMVLLSHFMATRGFSPP